MGNYVFRYSARGSVTVLDTTTVRINAQSVPEPTIVAMLGVGLASFVIARRRGLRPDVA